LTSPVTALAVVALLLMFRDGRVTAKRLSLASPLYLLFAGPRSCVEPSPQTACYWRLVVLGGGPSCIASAARKRLQNSMNSGAATSEIAQ